MLLTELDAFVFGQVENGLTFGATTAIVGCTTVVTLYKQQMAIVVGAVGVRISRLSTLVTASYYLSINRFAQAFVEHKVFAVEFRFDAKLLDLLRILNDASIQLRYAFESLVD